ncbi:MAG: hypothetical protein LBP72_05335, partial [Dysgonamonadaceae bacterium]|nr:hypothetical protein [Dysgonamonadaceae bacterium]
MKKILRFFIPIIAFANTYAQTENYSGKLVGLPGPCLEIPCLPGIVWGLATAENTCVLSVDNHYLELENKLVFKNTEYSMGDSVAVSGKRYDRYDVNNESFHVFEVEDIIKQAGIKLLATSLGGCNETALRAGENPLENDTVIISTVADTLNVFVGRNYICGAPFRADCEIRNDSIFMYITDTCENPSECYDRCDCYYTFDFQFAGQGDKNYPYKIVWSDPREDELQTISEGIISAAPPLNVPKVLSLPVSGSELFQNHPNPFKGETTIRYTLPAGVTRAE